MATLGQTHLTGSADVLWSLDPDPYSPGDLNEIAETGLFVGCVECTGWTERKQLFGYLGSTSCDFESEHDCVLTHHERSRLAAHTLR